MRPPGVKELLEEGCVPRSLGRPRLRSALGPVPALRAVPGAQKRRRPKERRLACSHL